MEEVLPTASLMVVVRQVVGCTANRIPLQLADSVAAEALAGEHPAGRHRLCSAEGRLHLYNVLNVTAGLDLVRFCMHVHQTISSKC